MKLVALIELTSPTNKAAGTGRESYLGFEPGFRHGITCRICGQPFCELFLQSRGKCPRFHSLLPNVIPPGKLCPRVGSFIGGIMGSWANSLHVRAGDARVVAEAIRAIVPTDGHRLVEPGQPVATTTAPAAPSRGLPRRPGHGGRHAAWDEDDDLFEEDLEDTDPGDEGAWDAGPTEPRGICVYEPVRGWVGVLDSGDIHELGRALSARLQTEALVVMVDDSDGWLYHFLRNGRTVDEFSSQGDTSGDGEISPELQAAMERGNEEEIERLLERDLLARAPRGPIWMPDGAAAIPPEMALLRQRIREGRGSLWDRLRYAWMWLRFQFQVLTGRWQPGGPHLGFDIPRTTPLNPADLERHVAQVREAFAGADAAALRALLPVSRFPAEEQLAEFLRLIGLPSLYAYLNYDYLEDHSEDELADAGIVRAAQFRFLPPA
jgi:hypothetical protein